GTGLVTIRNTGKYISLLVLESLFGVIVVVSNLTLIVILVIGWRKLLKNDFYIVLANLLVCTSLKAFVELGFIIPYYAMQGDGAKRTGYFSGYYELVIFNISVLADYGCLHKKYKYHTVFRSPFLLVTHCCESSHHS
ncbi:hypothetical protein PMAYCL1PPCAC_15863, partial [Pristionchus mayeri]